MNNYDNDWYRRPENPKYEKIKARSFWQRHQWAIIGITSALLAVIFASTTFYLLITRPSSASNVATAPRTVAVSNAPTNIPSTQDPTATTAPQLGATTVASTPQQATNLSPTTTNYQFICLDCNDKIGVELQDITINTSTQTMQWDFNITNNNSSSCVMLHGNLSLQAPTGETVQADGGTFTQQITMASGQTLPRSATFSSITKQDVQYTATLNMYCSTFNDDTYQSVLFSY